MCGIWCLTSKSSIKQSYDEYIDKLKARGPDDTKVITSDKFVLAFHRLAINDLSSTANQPFVFHDGYYTVYLMCNGEIYNYKRLIDKYNFEAVSHSDCEVIYHLMKHHNYDVSRVLAELEGEFAFVMLISDFASVQTIVARDRIGVRPLFWGSTGDGYVFSSLLAGVTGVSKKGEVFPPGHYMMNGELVPYYIYNYPIRKMDTKQEAYKQVTDRLIKAVKDRLISDRPIGCLLSGGLDSSLVVGILVHILGVKDLKTFSVGMNNGTDIKYAQLVADHLGTDHTVVNFDIDDAMRVLPEVVRTTESWDITTNRASIGQYLISKYISENTDIKVVINGDGADEVEMGYLYNYNHPSLEDAHDEATRLVREIHRYDGLRVDRCIGHHGLEARLPFLDVNFVDYYMGLPTEWRVPIKGKQMEKQFIREAFLKLYPHMLPYEVLFRVKEAFSDGVSTKEKSLYQHIQEHVDTLITDDEYDENKDIYEWHTPVSKEAYYYRKLFDDYFGDENAEVIPHYWLPKWCGMINEPSARVLSVYD
jgi:asparagine synthase (glutamine-hydrolysing)